MKDKLKNTVNLLCAIAIINFFGFTFVCLALKGRAVTGKRKDGICYVAFGDKYQQVTPTVYWFSMYYEIGTLSFLIFAAIARHIIKQKEKKAGEKGLEIFCFTGQADGEIEKRGLIKAYSTSEAGKIMKNHGMFPTKLTIATEDEKKLYENDYIS